MKLPQKFYHIRSNKKIEMDDNTASNVNMEVINKMPGLENKVNIHINEVPGGKRKLNNKTEKNV